MAKMKLYYSPSSPYARKVRVVAIETRLDKKIEMVNVALTPVAANADVDKHNPIGKIPALSVKGMDLFDSPVICEYLDSQHKGRKLLPRKGRERWVALRLQAMADGLLDAALLARYEGALRPEDKRWPDWSKGQMKKIDGVLAQLEAEAKSLKGKPTIGTISVACALGYLDFRFADHGLARQASQARQVVHRHVQDAVDEGDRAAAGLTGRRDSRRDHRAPRPAAASRGRPLSSRRSARPTHRAAPRRRSTSCSRPANARTGTRSMPTRSGITMPARRSNCR